MTQVITIHACAPRKPAWAEPCNGCGVCCMSEPCPIGMVVSRSRHGTCKALLWSDTESRYRCGLVAEPARFVATAWLRPWVARAAARMIAAGKGCDCDLTVEPQH